MFRIVAAFVGLATLTASAEAQDAPKPNVILIFADDLGYADLGCYGAKGFRTPHLDKMAAEGVKLTSFYTGCPVCSGSRAALLTGRHYQRVGVPPVMFPGNKNGIPESEITIASLLRQRGYWCGIIGKWHLGHLAPYLPIRRGFDQWFGIPYSNDMTIDAANAKFAPNVVFRDGKTEAIVRKEGGIRNTVPLVRGDEVVEYPVDQSTLTSRYAQEAVKLIGEHKDRPFFLYMPHTMPHVPLHASKAFAGRTETKFGDVMEELDDSVGTVLKAVKDNGLDEKTLVIFTSDNGAHQGSAGPLRGKKATVYEGGYRVPFVARWPGKIPAGSVVEEMAATVDMLPTLAKLAGGEAPKDRPIDGKDVRSLLFAEKGAKTPHEAYVLLHGQGAVRSGNWKFYPWPEAAAGAPAKGKKKADEKATKGPPTQLYDLSKDLGETRNVAEQHPDVVARLSEVFRRFSAEVGPKKKQKDE